MKVPVAAPWLDSLETEYVNDALKQGAISGFFGDYITRFESEFSRYSDCEHGVANSNGTVALHLALAALGIGAGDEVLTATLTNMATFFAVLYTGAKPVPIDCESDTWNLDPAELEAKITPRTKAIMVVHLFGHPVDMDPVMAIARKHNLYVIEDCAEAHGATYKGRKVGGIGHVGCFSFYANKIITTGEGGMITTNDRKIADKARSLRGLAFGDTNKFMHKDIGFNYRMTNLQAAIGCAQFKKIEQIIERKRKMASLYRESFAPLGELVQLPVEKPYARNVYWMYHLGVAGKIAGKREIVMKKLAERGVETRESFIPFNGQDIFIAKGLTRLDECPKANDIGRRGFYLPSGPTLTLEQMRYVGESLKSVIAEL
jgi:perosamine synthetase